MSAQSHPSGTTITQFATVTADRRAEAPKTLAEPVPQPLTLLDQFGLWGNLGVSLLGFTGALFVLQPGGAGTPRSAWWPPSRPSSSARSSGRSR